MNLCLAGRQTCNESLLPAAKVSMIFILLATKIPTFFILPATAKFLRFPEAFSLCEREFGGRFQLKDFKDSF